jgi:hypothetical protein
MVVSEAEIERMARDLIAQWGRRAAHVAIEGLNKSIDLKDWSRRDMWVRVVRAIHENQGSESAAGAKLRRTGPRSGEALESDKAAAEPRSNEAASTSPR